MKSPVQSKKESLLRGSMKAIADRKRHQTGASTSPQRRDRERTMRHDDYDQFQDANHHYGKVHESATHEEDFSHHLGMVRRHTFRGRKSGQFVHMYTHELGRSKEKSELTPRETLGALMDYHGFHKNTERANTNDPTKEVYDHPEGHRVIAKLKGNGGVSTIFHHERMSVHEELTEESNKMKKLRDVVPVKRTPEVETPPWPEKDAEKNFISLHKILRYQPVDNGEDVFVAVKVPSGEDGRMLAPDVGFKGAPEKLRKGHGIEED